MMDSDDHLSTTSANSSNHSDSVNNIRNWDDNLYKDRYKPEWFKLRVDFLDLFYVDDQLVHPIGMTRIVIVLQLIDKQIIENL